jgi:tetratricopeptide (TPR) repeat protein
MAVRQKQAKKIKRDDAEVKPRKKRTWKEIAVIVVSVIMVVTMLLPSFSYIFAGNSSSSSSSSDYPTTFDEAQSKYEPLVEEYQKQVDENGDDTDALYNLATAQYTWALYANSYASDDSQEGEATELFNDAYSSFGTYLGKIGSLDSTDAKTAAIEQALCQYYLGNTSDAEAKLLEVANETDYASAWFNLGLMYEADSDTEKAIDAYQKAEAADPDDSAGIKSYAESRISSLNSASAESTGGASGLSSALDGTSSSD